MSIPWLTVSKGGKMCRPHPGGWSHTFFFVFLCANCAAHNGPNFFLPGGGVGSTFLNCGWDAGRPYADLDHFPGVTPRGKAKVWMKMWYYLSGNTTFRFSGIPWVVPLRNCAKEQIKWCRLLVCPKINVILSNVIFWGLTNGDFWDRRTVKQAFPKSRCLWAYLSWSQSAPGIAHVSPNAEILKSVTSIFRQWRLGVKAPVHEYLKEKTLKYCSYGFLQAQLPKFWPEGMTYIPFFLFKNDMI